jgi:hypothetical protein
VEITINKIGAQDVNGDGSDVITTYHVIENDKEFRITCRSNRYGRNLGFEGKEGLLYVNRDNNLVHWQVVALGGGCGLLIDDDPVEGLSPWALRGVIFAEQSKEAREITIRAQQMEDSAELTFLFIDGRAQDPSQYLDVFEGITEKGKLFKIAL